MGPGHTGPVGSPELVAAVVILGGLALVAAIGSPWWRPRLLRFSGALLAIFLVFRGIAEFWIVDYGDPASYRHDWGGPTLVGVLIVHTGPGLVVVAATTVWFVRRRTRRRALK